MKIVNVYPRNAQIHAQISMYNMLVTETANENEKRKRTRAFFDIFLEFLFLLARYQYFQFPFIRPCFDTMTCQTMRCNTNSFISLITTGLMASFSSLFRICTTNNLEPHFLSLSGFHVGPAPFLYKPLIEHLILGKNELFFIRLVSVDPSLRLAMSDGVVRV